MKKFLLGSLLVCGITLAGCSDNEENAGVASSNTEVTVQDTDFSEEDSTEEMSFKNGTLETEEFKLSYDKAKIINSFMEDGSGIYITYKLENKSDENIIPSEVLSQNLLLSQENDTSEVELDPGYDTLNAFADEGDSERYNEQIDIDEEADNALKPGKEVEVVDSYYLDNKDYPIKMQAIYDEETDELSDSYEVKLGDLEEVPEPKSDIEYEE